jgi:predicted enzyme related to lactoylglutathione lyase
MEHRAEFRFYYFTPAYDETVAFYRDVRRFPVYRSWDRESGDRGTIFVAPNGHGLIEIEAGSQLPAIAGGFYIEVPDVDRWYDSVRAAGGVITKEPGDTDYGHCNFKTVDPSGIEVTFFRYIVDSR